MFSTIQKYQPELIFCLLFLRCTWAPLTSVVFEGKKEVRVITRKMTEKSGSGCTLPGRKLLANCIFGFYTSQTKPPRDKLQN